MLREIDQQTKNEMAFNENWRDEFAKRLDRNERKESQKFKRYLKKEYETIIDLAVQQNSIPNSNPYFKLNEIKDNLGSTKPRKRIGRGIGSGTGKTS